MNLNKNLIAKIKRARPKLSRTFLLQSIFYCKYLYVQQMALLSATSIKCMRCVRFAAYTSYVTYMNKNCVCVKRGVIHRINSIFGVSESTDDAPWHKHYTSWRVTTLANPLIRWNERLSCAYKHSGYAVSFSTECGTVVQVWHVQIFSFGCYIYIFSFFSLSILCSVLVFQFLSMRSDSISASNCVFCSRALASQQNKTKEKVNEPLKTLLLLEKNWKK